VDAPLEAMKESVTSDRATLLELEEHPGMVRLAIRLEKDSVRSSQLGKFLLFALFFTSHAGCFR
jgi:hypothetical protein